MVLAGEGKGKKGAASGGSRRAGQTAAAVTGSCGRVSIASYRIVRQVECDIVDRLVERRRVFLLLQSSHESEAELDPRRVHSAAFLRPSAECHGRVGAVELRPLLLRRLALRLEQGIPLHKAVEREGRGIVARLVRAPARADWTAAAGHGARVAESQRLRGNHAHCWREELRGEQRQKRGEAAEEAAGKLDVVDEKRSEAEKIEIVSPRAAPPRRARQASVKFDFSLHNKKR